MTQTEERKHPFYCHITKFLGDSREKRLNNGNLLIDLGVIFILVSLTVLSFDRDIIWLILMGLILGTMLPSLFFRGN